MADDILGDWGRWGGGWIEKKKNKKAIEAANKKNLRLLEELDWQPTYMSETAPTYQRTESPVARSYLESVLTGDNPAMTHPGETNAKVKQAAQQRGQNVLWGTPQERVARQRAIEQETPWAVTPPTRTFGQTPEVIKQESQPAHLRSIPSDVYAEVMKINPDFFRKDPHAAMAIAAKYAREGQSPDKDARLLEIVRSGK